MPVRLRGPQGQTVDAEENELDYYTGRGFVPLASGQEFREAEVEAAKPDDRGLAGSVSAATTGFLSGLTLGGSDVLFSSLASQNQREQLLEDRRANPIISTGAEIGGGLAASFAAPGSLLARTPAGVLAQTANQATGALRATTTGARALAGQAAITGAEAAAQNVGSYLGSVALGDRKLSAEGLGGALGTGFAFGGVAGGAVYGLEKGTIAARRMFSSVMEGGEDAAARAAGEWERRSKDVFDGNRANIDEARRQVEEARRASEQAVLAQRRAGAYVADERALAARARSIPPSVDDAAPPLPAAAGDALAPAGAAPDPAATAAPDADPIAAMEARIRAGEVPSERGPFTSDGLRAAAEREVAREGQRAALGGYDFAPRTGSALSDVRRGPGPTRPRAAAAADEIAPVVDDVTPAPGTFGADDFDPFADVPPMQRRPKADAQEAPRAPDAEPPGATFAKHNLTTRFDDTGREVELVLGDAQGQVGRLRMVRDGEGAYRLSHVDIEVGDLKGKGIGTAMYLEMGDYLQRKYGAPLLSDYSRSPSAERVWERLVKQGRARGVYEAGTPRDAPPTYYVLEPAASVAPAGAAQLPREQARLAALADEADAAERALRDVLDPKATAGAGVPSYAALDDTLAKSGDDYLEQTVPASAIAERGWYETPGGHLDAVRSGNARRAIAEGQREPIKLGVSESGKVIVMDGRHRLAAAVEAGAPIRVKWTTAFEPAADDVLRGGPGGAAARAPVPDLTDDPLMRALLGTKQGLDEGATIGQLGAAARAQPVSPRQMADEIERLTAAAAEAPDAAARQQLLRQAAAIEEQAAVLPRAQQAMTDLDTVTRALARYERVMAELADELGDAAAPVSREAAEALRKAEAEAERLMFDRAAQTIDDQADDVGGKLAGEGVKQGTQQGLGGADAGPAQEYGPFQEYGAARLGPKERVRYARDRKIDADAAVSRARVAETEARNNLAAAQARGREIGRAADTISLGGPARADAGADAADGGSSAAGRAADLGAALEVANMVGLPVPSASDIPVIGPIAGLYLKFRALKGGAERLMGRVPATGNARAAALAAQTKDRAARVVDRMLGMVERKAPAIRTTAAVAGPRLVEAVKERIYDDGSKPPGKDAGLQEQVAARSREISALAANPAIIARQVRRAMRDVGDPDLVTAAVDFRTRQVQYLDKVRPKEPPPSPFQRAPWKPDKQEAADFARRYAVAMDPIQALEQIEQRCLTPEAAEAFREVYPLLFQQTQTRLLEQATKLQTTLPRAQLTRMSILFGLPLDSALEPGALARVQATFTTGAEPAPPAGMPGQPPAPPTPSIAGPTDLTALYQTATDRRAAR